MNIKEDGSLTTKEAVLNNNAISISIHFGKKDGIITAWAQSLPWGAFAFITRDCIRAYINGNEDYKIPDLNIPIVKTKSTIKRSLRITKEDYDIYNYLISIEDSFRSFEIKKILQHYLSKNEKETIAHAKNYAPARITPAENKPKIPETTYRETTPNKPLVNTILKALVDAKGDN